MSLTHLELLDENQLKVFKTLKAFKKNAVLAGGTALALQLNHRYSFDFDLFQIKPVHPKDISLLNKTLDIEKIVFKSSDMVTLKLKDGVNFSLVYYWFKPLFPKIDAGPLLLFDYRDIALDKANTIGHRATWRDYFDLFYILKNRLYTIDEIKINAKKKFGIEFSFEHFLSQLTYYDDLDEFNLKFVDRLYSKEEIRNFLIQEAENYTKKIIK